MSEAGRHDSATLITGAAPSYDDQMAARKRKYALMMGMRFPCLILAGIFYHIWWLALILIAVSIPLPWIAVLIANDGPPRKAEKVNRYQAEPEAEAEAKAIERTEHHVIDG